MYEAILFEMPLEEGLNCKVTARMAELLPDEEGLFPITVSGNSSWATGYIRHSVADEKLDLDGNRFTAAMRDLLEDEELLAPYRQRSGAYRTNVAGIDTLLCRTLSELACEGIDQALADAEREAELTGKRYPSAEVLTDMRAIAKKTAPLSLELEDLKPLIYGMVDGKGRAHSFLLLADPRSLDDGSGYGTFAIHSNDAEYGSIVPYGEPVLLVWPDAEAFKTGADPDIRSTTSFVPKQDLTQIWARAGVNIGLTHDELMDVLLHGEEKGADILENAVKGGRVSFSGDSYVPQSICEDVLLRLGYDSDGRAYDVNFML